MYTERYDITDEWLLIASGVRNVGIQFDNQGSIRVHVGTAAPADPDAPGILVASSTEDVPSTFALGALPPDAQVYVRSWASTDDIRLTVLAY